MDNLPLADKSKSSVTQLFHYTFIGIVSNLAGYMVYLLVTNLGATPKITMTLLYGVGAAIGFIGNRKLTFAHKGSLLGSGVRYIIAHGFGYLINLAILIVLVDKLGYAHELVQGIAILVVAGFLFMVFKFFVFTDMDVSNKGEQ